MAMHEYEHEVYGVAVVSDELKEVMDRDPNYRYVGVQGGEDKSADKGGDKPAKGQK